MSAFEWWAWEGPCMRLVPLRDLLSVDAKERRQQWLGLGCVALGCVLVVFSAFVGAVVLFGDPPARAVWAVVAIVGLTGGFGLALGGNVVWRRVTFDEQGMPRRK